MFLLACARAQSQFSWRSSTQIFEFWMLIVIELSRPQKVVYHKVRFAGEVAGEVVMSVLRKSVEDFR